MIIPFIALAAAQPELVKASAPILCADSNENVQPIQRTSYGSLRAAFTRQFHFASTLTITGPKSGRLDFRGGVRGAETITYDVRPWEDGVLLLAMHVRLQGKREDLSGDDMCWQTSSIINVR